MAKVDFKIHRSLLKDVIARQAGSWKKGILELVQNSLDGCSVLNLEPKICIQVSKDGSGRSVFNYSDNAGGLGDSRDEVLRHFAVFGGSWKRGKSSLLGKFGMGRGQAISMIYNADKDCIDGEIEILSFGKRSFRLFNFRVDDELSFEIEGIGNPARRKGTVWTLKSSYRDFDVKIIQKYVQNQFILPYPILVNSEPVVSKPEGKTIATPDAVIHLKDSGSGFKLYERGLKVNEYDIFEGFSGHIVTKRPLDLNFARNDVIDSDSWQKIKAAVVEQCRNYMEKLDAGRPVSDRKVQGLLESFVENPSQFVETFADKKIFVLANGKTVSYNDTVGKEVYLSNPEDRVADHMISQGAIVLDRSKPSLEPALEIFQALGRGVTKIEDIPAHAAGSVYQVIPIEPRFAELFRLLTVFLDQAGHGARELKAGQNPYATAWTDGKRYIVLELRTIVALEAVLHRDGSLSCLLGALPVLAHELGHDSSTETNTHVHGPGFFENNLVILENLLSSCAKAATTLKKS